jgi:hypothetical protein
VHRQIIAEHGLRGDGQAVNVIDIYLLRFDGAAAFMANGAGPRGWYANAGFRIELYLVCQSMVS